MSEKSLPPVPPRYVEVNPPELVRRDADALRTLGYLSRCAEVSSADDETFRAAVAAFQAVRSLERDGLIGPVTRAAIAAELPADLRLGYLAAVDDAPKHTKDLSPAFFARVAKMVDKWNAKGAKLRVDNVLSVWNGESGVRASSRNAIAGGLNGMLWSHLPKLGFNGGPEGWVSLSAEEQLPYIERFYDSLGAPGSWTHKLDGELTKGVADWSLLDSAEAFYVWNWLPALVSHVRDESYVYAAKDDPRGATRRAWYRDNLVLDKNRDGRITIEDLRAHIGAQQRAGGARWIEVRKRAFEAVGTEPPKDEPPSNASGLVAVAILVGTSAVAAWAAVSG